MRTFCCLAVVASLATVACSSGNSNGAGLSIEPEKDTAAPSPPPEVLPQQRRGLVRSEPLPELAAKVLRKQMQRHAKRMEDLQWSALMLDHAQTQEIAEAILSEPRIARPAEGDDSLNQAIPPRFFDLQDQLFTHAQELLDASEKKDDEHLGEAYARLAKTCIDCHSLYLKLPSR